MIRIFLKLVAGFAAVLSLAGCASTYGAGTVAPSGFSYNTALAKTQDEQLLLNLVRLRYRDTTVFMDIESVTTSFEFSGALSAEAGLPFEDIGGGDGALGAGGGYLENPTISYRPLKGEEFATNLLAPISPETLVLLSRSGWSVERILLCCVEQFGTLSNAPSASGPTPSILPDNSAFRAAAARLRQIQQGGGYSVSRGPANPTEDAFYLRFTDLSSTDCEALSGLFGGRETCSDAYRLVGDPGQFVSGDILLQGRSVLGALYALSHAVEAPEAHEMAGIVTTSTPQSPATSDWDDYLGGLFKVEVSKSRPQLAYVSVFYRGHWFSIADNDLDSKTTFNLLTFLVALQSAASTGASPLLTINAG